MGVLTRSQATRLRESSGTFRVYEFFVFSGNSIRRSNCRVCVGSELFDDVCTLLRSAVAVGFLSGVSGVSTEDILGHFESRIKDLDHRFDVDFVRLVAHIRYHAETSKVLSWSFRVKEAQDIPQLLSS